MKMHLGKCMKPCGNAFCPSDSTCTILDNIDCSEVYSKMNFNRCSAETATKCVAQCDDDVAYLCLPTTTECSYHTSSPLPFPLQSGLSFYPVYTPQLLKPTQTQQCLDGYTGADGRPYCLGDVLWSNLSDPNKSITQAIDEASSSYHYQDLPMRQGQSKFGYYCVPEKTTGWRYLVVPPPENKDQCEASDCLQTLMSDESVKYIRYDSATKMCMGAVCEGACAPIRPQGPPSRSKLSDAGDNAHECGSNLDDEVTACQKVLSQSGGLCKKFGPAGQSANSVQFLPRAADVPRATIHNCDITWIHGSEDSTWNEHTVWLDPGTTGRSDLPGGTTPDPNNPIIIENSGSAYDAWQQQSQSFQLRGKTCCPDALGHDVDVQNAYSKIGDVPGKGCLSLGDVSAACAAPQLAFTLDTCNWSGCWGSVGENCHS